MSIVIYAYRQKHMPCMKNASQFMVSGFQCDFLGFFNPANASANGNGGKRRLRNFASPACGAKLLSANAEAQRATAVLSGAPDEYLLSPCKARVYFVVELCEAIQPSKVRILSLYS